MARKHLVVVLALLVSLLMVGSSTALGATQFRIGHIMNIDHPHHLALMKFAELVKEKTGGSVEVKIYPNSQLGNALTQIQAVKLGTLEGFLDGVGWYGQFQGDYYLPATAFAVRDMDHAVRIMDGPVGQAMAERLRQQHGLRVLDQSWVRLPRHLLSSKPVRSLADIKNLKLRIPELKSYVEPWRALGASPTPIAFAEVYLALQQGIVDAMECPLDMIYTQRLHEVAKYLTLTYHQFETGSLVVNDRWYSRLTPDQQQAIAEALGEAKKYNNELSYADELEIIEKMKEEGVIFIEIDRDELIEAAKDVPVRLEEEGLWTKGLYESALAEAEAQD